MAGERTPDTSPAASFAHTDNDISLREHMQRQIDTVTIQVNVALEAARRFHGEQDRRYEQRFVAQEQATALALTRVDKEFHEHLQQVREETRAALDAADKAIIKSETATEKRFESVNEFRGQLSDQATRFMPRLEAEQRIATNAEKMVTMEARFILDIQSLTSRLDKTQGQERGTDRSREMLGWVVGIAATLISIYFATKGG